jgi:O-methyltransferase
VTRLQHTAGSEVAGQDSEARQLYLDLMKRCLTNLIYADTELTPVNLQGKRLYGWIVKLFESRGILLRRRRHVDLETRKQGRDWSLTAHSMVGLHRLDNIQACAETVLRDGIPGDFIETGVWRGGSTIFMRALLRVHGVTDRTVWVADSFAGLPPPDEKKYPADTGSKFHEYEILAVSLDQVQRNFAAYGLLDDQVRFLQGWFRDTLPTAPIERLALLRLDGDMYESTMDALTALYPKLSPGGFCIIDDYHAVPACAKAVEDYRNRHGITERVERTACNIGAFWRKSR